MSDLFKPQSVLETITPDIAKNYLEKNKKNRPVNMRIVRFYQREMEAGRWTLSNDAITFDDSDCLINGQHRLMAVIGSGLPAQFFVTRFMPKPSFKNMDTGLHRSPKDVFYIEGVADSSKVAAIVRKKMVLTNEHTALSSSYGVCNRLSNDSIYEEFNNHKQTYINIHKFSRSLYSKSKLLPASDYGSIVAYLHIEREHDLNLCQSFFEEVCDVSEMTIITTKILRLKIVNNGLCHGRKLPHSTIQKLIIKAWNCYVTNKPLKVLTYNPDKEKDLWFL